MQQASGRPISYKVAAVASVVLGGSWFAYLIYMCTTEVTKQSVFMGEITHYTALLLAVTGVAAVPLAGGLLRLAFTRHPLMNRACLWAAMASLVTVAVFVATWRIAAGAV